MNENTLQIVRLPDGRRLSYVECGVPDGKPVLYCHGNPGSRLDCFLFDAEVIARLGVRLISPDRPGIGGSDFQPGRRLVDWPDDVCALADILGLERFAVLGYSGGGPYAAVCAYKIPQRLSAAGIASGSAPLNIPGATRGMGPGRYYFRGAATHPRLAEVFLKLMGSGMKAGMKGGREMSLPGMPATDLEAMRRPGVGEAFLNTFREACIQGTRGAAWDATLLARPWGFRLEDICMPIYLWHGEEDANAPVGMGYYVAQSIPNCRAKFFPGEGHFSLGANHVAEILSTLIG